MAAAATNQVLHEEVLAAVWPDESMGIGAMIASKLLLMHCANASFSLLAAPYFLIPSLVMQDMASNLEAVSRTSAMVR